MKIIFYVFICLMSLAQSVAMGDNSKKERAIYFCHRDIDSYIKLLDMFGLSSIGKEERDIEDDPDNEAVRNLSTKLGKPLLHFRHCFFLMADKTDEYPKQDKILISLEKIQTRGYGKAGIIEKESVSGGEDKETIKYKALSCVPIIQDNEHDRKLVSEQMGYRHVLPHLHAVWAELLDLMEKEEQVNYNTAGNNCCTAAFIVAARLIGYARTITLIRPTDYNFLGMGVFWGNKVQDLGFTAFDDPDLFSIGEITDGTMWVARKIWHMFKEQPTQNVVPKEKRENKEGIDAAETEKPEKNKNGGDSDKKDEL